MDHPSARERIKSDSGNSCRQGGNPQCLKKNKLRPHKNDYWCIPAKEAPEFIACMEDVRNGTVGIFAFVEPLGGVHHVSVREHRTAVDQAEEIRYLVDIMYPDAEKIILVMDNLNTHKPASLYKRYPPEEARRIIKKLEIHYTPKHGIWLDIAEIELNVMT